MSDMEAEIRRVLNMHSAENASNTPDFILAQYLVACLDAFNAATTARQIWYYGEVETPGQRAAEARP